MGWKLYDVVHNPAPNGNEPLVFASGGIFQTDGEYITDRQHYDAYLLLYTTGGEGFLRYDGKEHRLLPGTAFLIDCARPQLYRTEGEAWDFCWLHFTANTLKDYVDTLYRRHGAVFMMTDGIMMERRMGAVMELYRGYSRTAAHRAFGMLAELVAMLYSCGEESAVQSGIGTDTAQVMEMITKRYSDKLTLDMIAREVGRSKYYLSHQFKADAGIGIYAYLTLFRISKSKVLLQNTNLSVAEVSEQVGFESVSNFIRTFSIYESVTPHQYRKRWK